MTTATRPRHSLIPIAWDGWRFILPLLAITLILLILSLEGLALIAFLLTAFVVFFFRDPDRQIPERENLILSPADGKVISVKEVDVETQTGLRQRMIRVQIFLSVFNAHIQRSPAPGIVDSMKYNPGKFINALSDKASEENEHNMIWMHGPLGTIGIKQIAGVIARRVICTCRPGQHLERGQRIGLIRFGSRAEAYFPLRAKVQTYVGQKVKAGLSVLATMPEQDKAD